MTNVERALRAEYRRLRADYPSALAGCSFKINGRFKRKLGCCRYDWNGRATSIEVSKRLTLRDALLDQALETLRHEVAHALAGHEAGHGPEWRRWAVTLGARPKARCSTADLTTEERSALVEVTRQEAKWKVACTGCGNSGTRQRRPTRPSGVCCGKCGSALRFTDLRTGKSFLTGSREQPPVVFTGDGFRFFV